MKYWLWQQCWKGIAKSVITIISSELPYYLLSYLIAWSVEDIHIEIPIWKYYDKVASRYTPIWHCFSAARFPVKSLEKLCGFSTAQHMYRAVNWFLNLYNYVWQKSTAAGRQFLLRTPLSVSRTHFIRIPPLIHVTMVMALPQDQGKLSLAYQMVLGRLNLWCAVVSAVSWVEPDWLLVWGALDMQYTSPTQYSDLHNLQIVQSSSAI